MFTCVPCYVGVTRVLSVGCVIGFPMPGLEQAELNKEG